jgi:hypothetical protein
MIHVLRVNEPNYSDTLCIVGAYEQLPENLKELLKIAVDEYLSYEGEPKWATFAEFLSDWLDTRGTKSLAFSVEDRAV